MRYLNFGTSGLKVSEVILGTMTFGRESDENESIKILNYYLENGGNFIDTANVYAEGRSEEILGKALKGYRDEIVLATKVFFATGNRPNEKGASRKNILKAIENSLKRLQTDYVDLYQIHCWDEFTPIEETMETMDYLVNKGYVRYIGVSNFSGWHIEKALRVSEIHGYKKIISAQMQYNLIVRDIEMEVLHVCNAEGLSVMAWGPLGGGFLSGKYKLGEKPIEGRIATIGEGAEESWKRRATEQNFKILAKLEDIAKERSKTIPQVALNWLIYQKVFPILGARTLEQIKDNMGAVGWTLTQKELNELNEVSQPEEKYPYRFIKSANKK
ncbi:MAG: aldo/keto reductase [Caldisericum exile]|uniref:Aldo/keto reductase n=1 Tax=Caldisericum exile TaxID=693075 RepID=A0A2J6X674_9BACT|nr:MAG: aldo/keto reductase [Caldisericum exile]